MKIKQNAFVLFWGSVTKGVRAGNSPQGRGVADDAPLTTHHRGLAQRCYGQPGKDESEDLVGEQFLYEGQFFLRLLQLLN